MIKTKNCTLLSICIPTYNRAEIIRETLYHLVQIKNDKIEIIISDNCSHDNTQEIVKNFNDDRIKYFRNKENLGAVKNILFSLERANGQMSLLLSDEDRLDIKSLPALLKKIEDQNFSGDLSAIISSSHGYRLNRSNKSSEGYLLNKGDEALMATFFLTGYMSGICFNSCKLDFKKIRLELNKETYGYIDFYPHVFMLAICCISGNVYVFNSPFWSHGENNHEQRHVGKKSYIETIGNNHFAHPRSVINRCKKYIALIDNICVTSRSKEYIFERIIRRSIAKIYVYKGYFETSKRDYYGLSIEEITDYEPYFNSLHNEAIICLKRTTLDGFRLLRINIIIFIMFRFRSFFKNGKLKKQIRSILPR